MSEDTGWISIATAEDTEAARADLHDRWQNLTDEAADAVVLGLLEHIDPDDARAVFSEVEAYGARLYLRRLGLG